jgi:hypothetical protein
MPRKPNDIGGRRFGMLTAVEVVPERQQRKAVWRCVCDCGGISEVVSTNLTRGLTRSCGCLRRRNIGSPPQHGHAKKGNISPEYRSWSAMKNRCRNPSNSNYEYYGARGIVVWPEWENNFEAFLSYIGPRPTGTTIDRIDNSRGYFPGNVRWATPLEQIKNRRKPRPYRMAKNDGLPML